MRSINHGRLYKDLKPVVGPQSGVYGQTPEGSLFVLSSALTHDKAFRELVEIRTFPRLNAENHVVAGLAVTKLSAEDAASAVVENSK